MSHNPQSILAEALDLPEQQRSILIGDLIESLDQSVDADAEAAWDAEIARRVTELDAGTARTIPWDEVRNTLRAVARGRSK